VRALFGVKNYQKPDLSAFLNFFFFIFKLPNPEEISSNCKENLEKLIHMVTIFICHGGVEIRIFLQSMRCTKFWLVLFFENSEQIVCFFTLGNRPKTGSKHNLVSRLIKIIDQNHLNCESVFSIWILGIQFKIKIFEFVCELWDVPNFFSAIFWKFRANSWKTLRNIEKKMFKKC